MSPAQTLVDGLPVILRRSSLEEILGLRHHILRHGLPRETAIFPGDEAPTTFHFGGFMHDRTVACATFHFNQWSGRPAWQLRGMATGEEVRGRGVGKALLLYADQVLLNHSPVRLFWANARTPALPFYEKLGWQRTGDEFVIHTAGPHYKIVRDLTPPR